MPDFRDYVRRHLPPLGLPGPREAEIVEELALEFEDNYERALRAARTPADAFHDVTTQTRPWPELARELRDALDAAPAEPPQPVRKPSAIARIAAELRRDLAYTARQLWKSPGFATIAILMLALGIGANTAIFSLLNAVLLRSLPVRHPEQLVFLGKTHPEGSTEFTPHGETQVFSYPFFREFNARNQVFSNVAAIQSFLINAHARIGREPAFEKLQVELVSGTYFDTLGVTASFGRTLTPADDRTPGAHPVAVAAYSWWRNRFGPETTASGGPASATVAIGGTAFTIVGVAPPAFSGVTVGRAPDLWIPLAMQREVIPDRYGLDQNLFQSLHLIARLKPGIAMGQAQANTNLLFHQILTSFFGPRPSREETDDIQRAFVELTPAMTGRSPLRREFTSPLQILMAIVMIVLLVACANVANLLLARATARQREIAVRMSLGAERGRLIRQLLAESLLLSGCGALLGVAFAWIASRAMLAMVSGGPAPIPLSVTPDRTVLAFTAAVAILTVILFGLAPSLRATRLDLAPVLKAGRGIASAKRNRLARALVIGQVALSLMLVAGAGLFLRSLSNLLDIDPGFDRQNVLRLHLDPVAAGYSRGERLATAMQRIEDSVAAVPGVRAASFALFVFDGGGSSSNDITVPGRPRSEHDPTVAQNVVGPSYLDAMGMPVLLGRGLNARDNRAAPLVAVINQTMARVYFADASPLGRTFSIGDDPAWQNIQVVGLVKDAKYMSLEEKPMPAAFFSYAQHADHYLPSFVVRYAGTPALIVPSIRRAVAAIDPNLPVSDVATLTQMVDDFSVNRRLVAVLSAFFGLLAAALACIGIYGVMSYGVSRRTNEFGIRMALGAARGRVLWVVLRETLGLAAAGVAIGLALAVAASRLVASRLLGVSPTDPVVLIASAAAMIAAALSAGYLPARRATRIDPMTALRYE